MSSNQMSKGQVFIPNKTSAYFKSSFLPMLAQKSFSLVPKTVQLGKMSVKPHVKFRSTLKFTFFFFFFVYIGWILTRCVCGHRIV